LVASKQKADMTYRQLMEILGEATSMIQMGIVRENKQMVKTGADMVLYHPAPKHKPWNIMEASDRAGFKQSLLTFDPILDEHAGRAAQAAARGNWTEVSRALADLDRSCIACHAMWRDKAVK
jgi:hypothetical protein